MAIVEYRDIENYPARDGKSKTILTLFERRKNGIHLEFGRWRSAKQFALYDTEKMEYVYPPEWIRSFPLTGEVFETIMEAHSQLFADLDNKIREIGKLGALGVDFVKYSINALGNVITIIPEAYPAEEGEAPLESPIQTFPGEKFAKIVQLPANAELISRAEIWAFGYASDIDVDIRVVNREGE